MGQHTPGPLIVSAIRRTMDGQQWLRVVTSKENREVAYVTFGDRTPHEYHQCRADARLYAAAPALLQELKRAVDMADPTGIDTDYHPARAAIAQAEASSQ